VQQQPELVGPETVTTEPVGEAPEFEVLDPVLALPPLGIPAVNLLWRIGAGGDHKAGIESSGQHPGFDDHPLGVGPGISLVGRLAQ